MPKVSVIIPVYNRADLIKETVDSVLSQNFEDFELILIDDASTDNTLEFLNNLAKKDKRIVVLKNKINKGRSGAVNHALKKAKGEFITFLDSDDLFTPGRLLSQVDFFDKNPDIDMLYGNMKAIYPDREVLVEAIEFNKPPLQVLKEMSKKPFEKLMSLKYASALLNEYAFTKKFENKFIPCSSVMLKRKTIESGVRCDEDTRNYAEDLDMWMQVIGKKFKLAKQPITTFLYRIHQGQKSVDKRKLELAKEFIIKKLIKGEYFR